MSYIIIQITFRMMNDDSDCNYFMIFIVVIMENNYQFSYDQFFLFYFVSSLVSISLLCITVVKKVFNIVRFDKYDII